MAGGRGGFGVPIIDSFASTEGLVGASAPDDEVITLCEDGCIVELIDADPDAQGRVGACVTFTLPLHSPAMSTIETGTALADENPAQEEEPQLPAVVHK